ncbi:hypothetical protein TNIN_473601 [Trichonephila inaurata madagascariensis]|uniref:Uncharacterized protein n=1 Tax=Trichonephila inaurata madagascariensis TaxID=2747483 RepID=A0A8X6Y258_9ARAC|nr:hypothetical protein TNIN_473601 [Trichonephila inaurata madagascariensis]
MLKGEMLVPFSLTQSIDAEYSREFRQIAFTEGCSTSRLGCKCFFFSSDSSIAWDHIYSFNFPRSQQCFSSIFGILSNPYKDCNFCRKLVESKCQIFFCQHNSSDLLEAVSTSPSVYVALIQRNPCYFSRDGRHCVDIKIFQIEA